MLAPAVPCATDALTLPCRGLPLEFIGLLRQCFGTRFQLRLIFIVVFPTQSYDRHFRAYWVCSFFAKCVK